jgi:Bacterial SH3 domain
VQAIITPGKYVVIARSGLRLRAGPGTDFEVERLLPLGTALTVVAIDPIHAEWARVDLEGDGLLDGYVHSGFIGPADEVGNAEFAPEPDDGDNG